MRLGLRRKHLLIYDVFVAGSAAGAILIWPDAWAPVGLVSALCLVAAWGLVNRSTRHFHGALSRIRLAADALGQGDLSKRVDVHAAKEVEKLIRSFNQMADRLERTEIEQHRLREELIKNEKLALIGEVAATVVHEINNPLDGMQNCSRILRRNLDDSKQAQQLIDLMDNGLYRIEMIVRRLLTLARDEVTTLRPRRLDYCVADALAYVSPRLQRNAVRVVRDFPKETVFANVDRPQISQALINLMLNAADAMPNGGQLTIRIDPPDLQAGTVKLSFRDTGIGMTPETQARIFEPFFSTKKAGGTGLGLAVVQKIIRAHNGRVDVESELDHGTTFAITLQAARSVAIVTDAKPVATDVGV